MAQQNEYQWDKVKAETNRRKHGVTFDMAAEVLDDAEHQKYHIIEYDDEHSMEEDRYITWGAYTRGRKMVLRISWTAWDEGDRWVIRIISARRANRSEAKGYVEAIRER
jgi:uncharacterized DUF497 family protein